ncbi:hypothetical protein ACQP2X_15750 [Actinoplanes sp. CA-131856]
MRWIQPRRWAAMAGVAALVAGAVVAAQPAALAATTIRVDSLTPYQTIKPGVITVNGHTTGSPAGETVRILVNNDLKVTVPVVDGRFSGTFDTGPLSDGVYTIYADVPDNDGGWFSNGTNVYVDEDPGDIVVTSPARGSTVTSFGAEGQIVTGRVAHPEAIRTVGLLLDDRSLFRILAPVAEDGTFRMVVPPYDMPQDAARIAVAAYDCGDQSVCRALGISDVTVKVVPSAKITAPTAGQVIRQGVDRTPFGLQVTNPGPADEVSATIDGTLPVDMQSPLRPTPTQSLYWTSVFVPRPLGEGRHVLHMNAKIRGVTLPVPDVTFYVDYSAPTGAAVAAPATVLTTSAAVSWSATDKSGIANYDVRWRTNSGVQPMSAYTYPANLQATTASRTTVPLTAGKAYCFSARAHDVAARTSEWSAERCTLSPFDDRWMNTMSKGGKRVAWKGFFGNTATVLPAKGSVTRYNVTASQVGVVARTCPTCGTLTATLAGLKLGTVSLRTPKITRLVIWVPAIGQQRIGTLTLTASTPATLDGVLLRR